MIEENICDGDLVLCERCQKVPNGTIVVALINGHEATLKRIYYEKNKIRLKPANKDHKVQVYKPEEVEIQGKFIGLIRLNEY
jgi:repressor LexA